MTSLSISASNFVEEKYLGSSVLVAACASILPLYLSMFRLNVGPVILRAADAIAIVVVVVTLLSSPTASRAFFRPPLLLIYAFAVYVLCQGVFQARVGASIKECAQLLFVAATVVVSGVHIKRQPQLFLHSMVCFCLLSMALTLLFHFSHGYFYRYKFAGDGRYIFGVTSALLLLISHQSGWRPKWSLAFLASLIPLVASLERKGPLGVAVIAVLLLAISFLRRNRVHLSIPLLFMLIGIGAATLAMHEQIGDYFLRSTLESYFVDESAALSESNVHRRALLLNGWDIFSRHWLWGTGADSVAIEMRSYFRDPRLANGTHNFYLDSLIKFGVVGAGLLFATVVIGAIASVRQARNRLASGLLAAYLLFVITFVSEGTAVTLMALLPLAVGPLFDQTVTNDAIDALPQ